MKIERDKMDYIGDGVYALFDGYGIWLHANHHEHPTDRVYLEPQVLKSLMHFSNRFFKLKGVLNEET